MREDGKKLKDEIKKQLDDYGSVNSQHEVLTDFESEAKVQLIPDKNLDLLPTYLRICTFLAKVNKELGYYSDA